MLKQRPVQEINKGWKEPLLFLHDSPTVTILDGLDRKLVANIWGQHCPSTVGESQSRLLHTQVGSPSPVFCLYGDYLLLVEYTNCNLHQGSLHLLFPPPRMFSSQISSGQLACHLFRNCFLDHFSLNPQLLVSASLYHVIPFHFCHSTYHQKKLSWLFICSLVYCSSPQNVSYINACVGIVCFVYCCILPICQVSMATPLLKRFPTAFLLILPPPFFSFL